MIVIDHISGYKTKYLHMSRFHRKVRRNSNVHQGQIIGYVGSTGYATGPHLHFEMHKHRRVIDPLKVNLPSSDPIPVAEIDLFKEHIAKLHRFVARSKEPAQKSLKISGEEKLKSHVD